MQQEIATSSSSQTQDIALDPKEIEAGKIMAVLCYIPIMMVGLIVAIVCLAQANNAFSLYHAKQALGWYILGIAASFVYIPLCFILIGIPLIWLLGLAGFVFMILGIINASSGKCAPLPIIGGLSSNLFRGIVKKT